MKEELGLDHFEGRSWIGLHRHALMTMIAFVDMRLRKKSEFNSLVCHTDARCCLNSNQIGVLPQASSNRILYIANGDRSVFTCNHIVTVSISNKPTDV